MDFVKKTKIILFISAFLLMFFSCQKENLPDYESFLIEVESVDIPAKVIANTPFNIQFFGTIGNNGCYQFSHFNTVKKMNTVVIEVWGKHNTSSKICSGEMVELRGKQLIYTIKEPGNYTFEIKQSEDHSITKQILVE